MSDDDKQKLNIAAMAEAGKQERNDGAKAAGEVDGTGVDTVDKQELKEIKTEQVFGEQIETAERQARPISEEEAKALIAADRLDVERGMAKADNHGKKVLKVVAIAAVVMLVLGVGAWVVSGMFKGEDDGTSGNGDSGTSVTAPGKDETGKGESGNGGGNEGEKVEGVALDDGLVQRLYGNFYSIPAIFDGWWDFYLDNGAREGEISRERMLLLAGANLWGKPCAGTYEYGNGGQVVNDCASGEAVRQKVAEMFGKTLELAEGDKIGAFCGGMVYNVANDEFYRVGNGCGGASSARMGRELVKAERKGDYLYLYEKVLLFDETMYYAMIQDGGSGGGYSGVFGQKIGEYDVPYDEFQDHGDYEAWMAQNEAGLISEYGDEFKWTFKKNAEGNYVFEGVERL